MNLLEASFNGTFRTILVLLLLWWLLRMFMRAQAQKAAQRPAAPQRPRGDVRIEPVERKAAHDREAGIIDAEFEEIK